MATGFCKLCSSSFRGEINKRFNRGDSAPAIREWLESKDFNVSLPTLYTHKQHITDPKTTLVESAQRDPAIKRVTTGEFLQAVVDIGYQKAVNDPDSVSLGLAVKAADSLEKRANKQLDALIVFAQIVTNRQAIPMADVPLLEGEYTELEPSTAQ